MNPTSIQIHLEQEKITREQKPITVLIRRIPVLANTNRSITETNKMVYLLNVDTDLIVDSYLGIYDPTSDDEQFEIHETPLTITNNNPNTTRWLDIIEVQW